MTRIQRTVALGEVVELVMGQAPPSKDCNFDGNGTPFVKVGEFGLDRPVIREWTTNPLRMARKSDVLLCVVGATCGKINLGEDCAIGRSVAAIRPSIAKLDQYYLYYFMMTLVERLRTGSVGAAQTVISKDMISSVELPFLPLPEQRRVVTILDEAFDDIATAKVNAERNLQNARALFESYLQSVFTNSQEGWREVKRPLAELCELIIDCEHKTAPTQEHGIPSIRTPNIGKGELLLDGVYRVSEETFRSWTRRAEPRPGDLILAREAPAGNVAVIPENLKVCLGQRTVLIRPMRDVFEPYFLALTLLAPRIQKKLLAHSRGATVQHVNMKDIRALNVGAIPVLKVQRSIEATATRISKAAEQLQSIYQRKLAALDELKKSLLDQAFSGQL